MKAYVLIKVHSSDVPEALRQLRAAKGVVTADMTFGPYDAIAVVEAKDLNTVGRIVALDIQPVVGVLDTLTCLVIEGV
jgi:DNA-binding Lrp family transcriptional regulator